MEVLSDSAGVRLRLCVVALCDLVGKSLFFFFFEQSCFFVALGKLSNGHQQASGGVK